MIKYGSQKKYVFQNGTYYNKYKGLICSIAWYFKDEEYAMVFFEESETKKVKDIIIPYEVVEVKYLQEIQK